MSYLLEIKVVLDEVLEELDKHTGMTHRALEDVSVKLRRLDDQQHSLPDDLRRRYSKLVPYLSSERRYPDLCIAEIKRFHGALLAAIQDPPQPRRPAT